MWYAVIETATGRLLSTGTVLADPMPKGLEAIEIGDEPPAGEWNTKTLQFEPSTRPVEVEPIDLLRKIASHATAKGAVGAEGFILKLAIERSIDLKDAANVAGMDELVAKGLLTTQEAAELKK